VQAIGNPGPAECAGVRPLEFNLKDDNSERKIILKVVPRLERVEKNLGSLTWRRKLPGNGTEVGRYAKFRSLS
jgi:hypothetical protein